MGRRPKLGHFLGEVGADVVDVLGFPDEGSGDEVDVVLDAEGEIGFVFDGQGGEVHLGREGREGGREGRKESKKMSFLNGTCAVSRQGCCPPRPSLPFHSSSPCYWARSRLDGS